MEKGTSRDIRTIFRFMDADRKEEMEFFVNDAIQEEYMVLESEEQVRELFGDSYRQFLSTLKTTDLEKLKHYTGFSYKEINAIMRDKWNYEENGELTEEKKTRYKRTGYEISEILNRCPSLNANIKVYRGTSLKQFHEYGIYSLADLKVMEGKYFYEKGFTSTSLVRDRSLLGMSNFFTGDRNVEIEYLIPACSQDGGLLMDSVSSFHDEESEFLINKGSMSKILSVEIDEEKNTAFIRAALVPQMVWDPPYMVEQQHQNKMG